MSGESSSGSALINDVYNEIQQHGGLDRRHEDISEPHYDQPQMQPMPPTRMMTQQEEMYRRQQYEDAIERYDTSDESAEQDTEYQHDKYERNETPPQKQQMIDVSKHGIVSDNLFGRIMDMLKEPIVVFVVLALMLMPYMTYMTTTMFPFTKENVMFLVIIKAIIGTILYCIVRAII